MYYCVAVSFLTVRLLVSGARLERPDQQRLRSICIAGTLITVLSAFARVHHCLLLPAGDRAADPRRSRCRAQPRQLERISHSSHDREPVGALAHSAGLEDQAADLAPA